jgi:hypothetical protein
LSGIIKHYEIATNDISILGLWERTLSQDLLWMRAPGGIKVNEDMDWTPQHMGYIPSWSWLSCPHGIWFDLWISMAEGDDRDKIQDHVNLLEWAVNWISEPWTSDLKSAALIINGPVREIELNRSPGIRGKYNPPYFDACVYGLARPNLSPAGSVQEGCNVQFDGKPPERLEQHLCMLIRSYKGPHKMKETFIILEPCSGADSFRRIGIGNLMSDTPRFDLAIRRTVELV